GGIRITTGTVATRAICVTAAEPAGGISGAIRPIDSRAGCDGLSRERCSDQTPCGDPHDAGWTADPRPRDGRRAAGGAELRLDLRAGGSLDTPSPSGLDPPGFHWTKALSHMATKVQAR